jgi:hypothetical protein
MNIKLEKCLLNTQGDYYRHRLESAKKCRSFMDKHFRGNGSLLYPGAGGDLHNPLGFTGLKHYVLLSAGINGYFENYTPQNVENELSNFNEIINNCGLRVNYSDKHSLSRPYVWSWSCTDNFSFNNESYLVDFLYGTYEDYRQRRAQYSTDMYDVLFWKDSWVEEKDYISLFLKSLKIGGFLIQPGIFLYENCYGLVPPWKIMGLKDITKDVFGLPLHNTLSPSSGWFDRIMPVYVYEKVKEPTETDFWQLEIVYSSILSKQGINDKQLRLPRGIGRPNDF